MNQTYSGLMLLGIIVACALILFLIASSKRSKPDTQGSNMTKLKVKVKDKAIFKSKPGILKNLPDAKLVKLKKRVSKSFPELTTSLRQHHLIIEYQSKKIAMLTVDKTAAIGRRRLGEVIVINFHDIPSAEELKIELKF